MLLLLYRLTAGHWGDVQGNANPFHTGQVDAISRPYCTWVTCRAMPTPSIQARLMTSPGGHSISRPFCTVSALGMLHQAA